MNSIPYTLSHPLDEARRNIASGGWMLAMNYLLDFMETGAAYASIVLLAAFRKDVLSGSAAPAPAVQGAIRKIDAKRPLSFGDWVNDILAPLAVEAASRFPDNPFARDIAAVAGRKKNIFLPGKSEAGIVQIRNRYKGHGTILSESRYEEVVRQILPRAEQFAAALESIGGSGVDLERDLYPLVHRAESGCEYVFQTLNDEQVCYVSTDENTLSLSTGAMNSDFDAWMQTLLPSFDIAKDLNWDEAVAAMAAASSEYMRDIYSQKKYNREQFVERERLNRSYREFLDSDRVVFPLPGEAGQGKTNQLCHWTETLTEEGEAVLIFAGASFADIGLEERLRKIFGLSARKDIGHYLEYINMLAGEAGRVVHIFFDAVNEAIVYPGCGEGVTGPLMLFRDICRLFARKELGNVKVLLTCRNYTWTNDLVPEQSRHDASVFFTPADEGGAAVRGFTDGEVRSAYSVYGELFQMETPFDALPRGVVLRLKDPLMLKIACTNYLGRELPATQAEYTSLSLFGRMLDEISRSYAGRNQVKILRGIARYMLGKYLEGEAVDSISADEVRAALGDPSSPLNSIAPLMFKNDGITVAFAELLNRPERPVLRLTDRGRIQFVYERFLEYLLSVAYVESVQEIDAAQICGALNRAAVNEVFMGALRGVLLIDCARRGGPDTAVELLYRYGEDLEVFSLVSSMMDVLVRELYKTGIFEAERRLLTMKGDGTEESTGSIIRLRNLAASTIISGILLSDAHNEGLYDEDPYELLWILMDDPLTDVRNNACMQAYYVSKRTLTLNDEPLRENVTQQIISRMFDCLRKRSLVPLMATKKARGRTVALLEAGVRLDVIMIIDLLLEGGAQNRARVTELLDEIRALLKHLTLNYSLVRALMPFISVILRRQVTFQSDYVNNITEYRSFWNSDAVSAAPAPDGRWNRTDITDIAPMAFLYSRKTGRPVSEFAPRIARAYRTGDSLSYFLLERLMVIFAMSDIEATGAILGDIENTIKGTEWEDYSQMSLIYILYQTGLKVPEFPAELMDMLERNCVDWTRRCKGYFRARNSHLANPRQEYKRNVMSWYAMVWCARHSDAEDPTGSSVPLFRRMIEDAVALSDSRMLLHLVDNISELITDSGDIHTALDLLKLIFTLIPSQEILDRFDGLVPMIGNILGVAKNYYPSLVNDFLTRGLSGVTFPGISKYRDDLLSYNPSGEKLSDLLTHKFGNFIIWALIHEENVDAVVVDCLEQAAGAQDCEDWFDSCVKIVLRALLNIKI